MGDSQGCERMRPIGVLPDEMGHTATHPAGRVSNIERSRRHVSGTFRLPFV
jgi:hypothetical protein